MPCQAALVHLFNVTTSTRVRPKQGLWRYTRSLHGFGFSLNYYSFCCFFPFTSCPERNRMIIVSFCCCFVILGSPETNIIIIVILLIDVCSSSCCIGIRIRITSNYNSSDSYGKNCHGVCQLNHSWYVVSMVFILINTLIFITTILTLNCLRNTLKHLKEYTIHGHKNSRWLRFHFVDYKLNENNFLMSPENPEGRIKNRGSAWTSCLKDDIWFSFSHSYGRREREK